MEREAQVNFAGVFELCPAAISQSASGECKYISILPSLKEFLGTLPQGGRRSLFVLKSSGIYFLLFIL